MCGIYGTNIPYALEEVKQKLKRTGFRGPDMMGCREIGQGMVFGHNRLSIIDLDPRSNQPFEYHGITIVFNGEVFNFRTLKKELQADGFEFRTESDTEVIGALYLKHGQACVKYLNGMFAFVIYDPQKKELFGARDRTGQKPFYIYRKGRQFEFASQLSSIQLFHQELTISSRAIDFYLNWGKIPDPMSIFNEVEKLLPGHQFTFKLGTGEYVTSAYWDIDYEKKKPFKGTFEEAKSELDALLTDAVGLRLFADVPVGLFLSGGVDSSIIAALACKVSKAKVKTFSVKFNESKFDESKYAQQVADHLGTDHHQIVCSLQEGLELIENFHHYYDEPFADSSAIPTMLLSKHTRKQVTVALSGDAGDENFLGYARYQNTLNEQLFQLPYGLRKPIGKALEWIPNYKTKVIAKAFQIKNIDQYYLHSLVGIDRDWIDSKHNVLELEENKYLCHQHSNMQERRANFDLKTYLNWDINTKVDRASMAFSLETRSPLLDHRVIELANSLPTDFKMQGNNQKRILKEVLYHYVPKPLFDRPKAGFTMPFADWFRKELKEYVMDELSEQGLKSIPMIHPQKVRFRMDQHMSGTWNRAPMIWRLLVLKQWLNHNPNHPIV